MLSESLEKLLFVAGDDQPIRNLKHEFIWQLNHFPIIIEAFGFFTIDRRLVATVNMYMLLRSSIEKRKMIIDVFLLSSSRWRPPSVHMSSYSFNSNSTMSLFVLKYRFIKWSFFCSSMTLKTSHVGIGACRITIATHHLINFILIEYIISRCFCQQKNKK